MANFDSSMLAMSNLMIGLARGYRKRMNQIAKRHKTDVRRKREAEIDLEDDFMEYMERSLEGKFPTWLIKDLASKMMLACDRFEDK